MAAIVAVLAAIFSFTAEAQAGVYAFKNVEVESVYNFQFYATQPGEVPFRVCTQDLSIGADPVVQVVRVPILGSPEIPLNVAYADDHLAHTASSDGNECTPFFNVDGGREYWIIVHAYSQSDVGTGRVQLNYAGTTNVLPSVTGLATFGGYRVYAPTITAPGLLTEFTISRVPPSVDPRSEVRNGDCTRSHHRPKQPFWPRFERPNYRA